MGVGVVGLSVVWVWELGLRVTGKSWRMLKNCSRRMDRHDAPGIANPEVSTEATRLDVASRQSIGIARAQRKILSKKRRRSSNA